MRRERWLLVGGSLIVVAHAANLFLRGLFGVPASTVAFVLLVALFATWHGVLRYGFARILAFGVGVTLISGLYETLSMLTGFPFGWYQYTAKIGPMVGLVPLIVPPVYFAMGYVSWAVAHALLSVHDGVLSGWRLIAVPIAAAFIMVIWHLPIDPVHATVGGYWAWRQGGPFFGVPLSNFAGWWLCVWTFFMAFAAFNRAPPAAGVPPIVQRRFYWLLPVGIYVAFTLDHVGGALAGESHAVATRDGRIWWTGDIRGSMMLIAMITSVPIALNAVYRIFRDLPAASGAERDPA